MKKTEQLPQEGIPSRLYPSRCAGAEDIRDASPVGDVPIGDPSPWVRRFGTLIGHTAVVLDFACGGGRHARWLAARGCQVVAADRDAAALRMLSSVSGVETVEADLEAGAWPFEGRRFDAVVVTNYLYRPRLALLLDCLAPGGVLIYETFMRGNERFGRPANPAFLLAAGELLARLHEDFTIVAFEQGEVTQPKAAMIQRVCAIRGAVAPGCLPPS